MIVALAASLLIAFTTAIELPIKVELGTVQSVAVKGTLMCNEEPAANVKVKLYDEEVTIDALLDEEFSNAQGQFELSGKKSEVSSIDPKINIYHKCSYTGICFKKISIEIPDEFISPGENATRVYDVGQLNLASKFSGESVDCFN